MQHQPPDLLGLLYSQHRSYIAQLSTTHHGLSKLYNKMARLESALTEGHGTQLPRKQKKKLQWSRSVTKITILKLEAESADLHEYLRQSNDLIASCERQSVPQTPWTGSLPPTPFLFTPYSPVASSPWAWRPIPAPTSMAPHPATDRPGQGPQYWDLSMLRERRYSSPYTSSDDSGFYEPAVYPQVIPANVEDADPKPNHVYAHELMSSPMPLRAVPAPSTSSSAAERDDVPEIVHSPTKLGADGNTRSTRQRRRFSENANETRSSVHSLTLLGDDSVVPERIRSASASPAVIDDDM